MEQAALRALREAAGSSAAGAAGGSAALCSGRSAAETKFAALRALQVAALLPAASVSLLPTAPNCFPQRRGRLEALPPYALVETRLKVVESVRYCAILPDTVIVGVVDW